MERLYRAKEDFLKYLESFRGYSSHTLRAYHDAIDEMLSHASIQNAGNSLEFDLFPWRVRIASYKAKSIAQKISAVRSFVKFLNDRNETVVLRGDESVKVPKTLPKPIPHERIVQTIERAEPLERCIILVLYTMGLRISELAGLKVSDLDGKWCRVIGKGSKQRDIPVPKITDNAIRFYVAEHGCKTYVFEREGEKLSENSLRYILTKAFAREGLKVTPHQLRHSYATELLNQGARIADVSELLGHESMATTQIYTKLGNALKMDQYKQSHPLCKNDGKPQ